MYASRLWAFSFFKLPNNKHNKPCPEPHVKHCRATLQVETKE